MPVSRRLVIVVLLGACLTSVAAREQAAATSPQRLGSGVVAIVVDAVVRDHNGNPVMDLRKDDFHLVEDGAQQDIQDLTVVRGPSHSGSDVRAGQLPAISPSFTAIVFNRLSPEARGRAYQAALACLETLRKGDFIGVFATDLSLTAVHRYTSDKAAVRKALDEVAKRTSWSSPQVFNLFEDWSAPPATAAGDDPGAGAAAVRSAQSAQNATAAAWGVLDQQQQGYATTNALLAITAGLSAVPGRKSVVLFSEGIPAPDQVLHHFRNVISSANRSNVSVYTIDAAGLRTSSQQAEAARNVMTYGSGYVGDALRSAGAVLETLARETGGLFVENTNDLRRAFLQVDTDRRFYYLLSYTPKNTDFNGKWRSITVKVPNRRVTVRARSGYLATREPSVASLLTLLDYERPALAALEVSGRAKAPADLPVRAAALVFPGAAQSQVAVLAATDSSALRFETDADTGKYRTDFAILARILNASGDVVRKGSQPYRLTGPAGNVEEAKRGQVLFYRSPSLEPGTYTLEVAVHDALASKSGVHRSTFVVPEIKPDALQVSSLVLVRRAERVRPEERDKANPLYVGDVLIYPNLGEPIRKSQEKAVTFVMMVRLKPDATEVALLKPDATAMLEVVRADRTVAQVPLALPAPDASGRIEHIAQVPLAQLSSGRYTLRLTISAAGSREVREASFEVIE